MGPSGCEGCIEDLVDLEVIVGDAPDGALQLVPRLDLLVAREVAGEDLGIDLDLRVGGHELLRDVDARDHLDAHVGERVVLHVAHGDEAVDLLDAEPEQRVGHQLLAAQGKHGYQGARGSGAHARSLSFTHSLTYLRAHLEAHVLHARDHLGPLEVVLRGVAALLPERAVERL